MLQYTEIFDNIPGEGCCEEDWLTGFKGCNCIDTKTCSKKCSCLSNVKHSYTESGLLDVDPNRDNWHLYPINECNIQCGCSEDTCRNRLVQHGSRFSFERFETSYKGYGLRTKECIPARSFVIAYLGEVISSKVRERLIQERLGKREPNYIMSLQEYYLKDDTIQRTIIDARNYGCEARFINHSCEPNTCILPVRINSVIPQAALFALRDIEPLEELSYDYNGSIDRKLAENEMYQSEITESEYKCYCGANKCRGKLPTNTY